MRKWAIVPIEEFAGRQVQRRRALAESSTDAHRLVERDEARPLHEADLSRGGERLEMVAGDARCAGDLVGRKDLGKLDFEHGQVLTARSKPLPRDRRPK